MKSRNRVFALMCAAAAMAGANGATGAIVNVTDDIGTSATWYNSNEYHLSRIIYVTNGATLTIEPGTLIRGQPREIIPGSPPVTNEVSALFIGRGSKIRAMGTEAQPIVMTDKYDNHYVGPTPTAGGVTNGTDYADGLNDVSGGWGGLVLMGDTYIASIVGVYTSPSVNVEKNIEGTAGNPNTLYGGADDDDNSGEIHYVSIRYGGSIYAANDEINGLTLGAVGRGTQIDHVEVFKNKDDGIEFFGGTPNLKYMVVWANGDDGYDWDEGYRGKGQFWLLVQGPTAADIGDKGSEMDGATGKDYVQPSSAGTIYNATYIGMGKDRCDTLGIHKNTALHFRDGGGGRFYNSLFMDFGGACALIEGATTNSEFDSADQTAANYTHSAFYALDTDGSKMLEIKNCYFWNMGTNATFGCNANTTGDAGYWGAEHNGTDKLDGNKAHLSYPLFSDSNLSNTYDAGAMAPIEELTRSTTLVNNYYPVEFLNALITNNVVLMSGGRLPPADGFFTPVKNIGAFGSKNWAGGWTVASHTGMLLGDADGGYSDPAISGSFISATIQFPTVMGANYTVQCTTNEATMAWADLATGLSGSGAEYTYTDQRPITESRVYRVLSTELAP